MYLKQRTLCVLESQAFFGCEISSNADFFFSVQIGENLVFFEPLSCQISNFFFFFFFFFGWGAVSNAMLQ